DPRLDDQQLSYEWTEVENTDMGYDKTRKDSVKPRQEAVVKGISPDLPPAPLSSSSSASLRTNATNEESGFWKKMLTFFGMVEEVREEKTPEKPVRENRSRRTSERSPRNTRTRGGQRSPSRDRAVESAPETRVKEEVTSKPQAHERKRKSPAHSRKESAATEAQALEVSYADVLTETDATAAASPAADKGTDNRRRRHRGLRNNRQRRDAHATTTSETENGVQAASSSLLPFVTAPADIEIPAQASADPSEALPREVRFSDPNEDAKSGTEEIKAWKARDHNKPLEVQWDDANTVIHSEQDSRPLPAHAVREKTAPQTGFQDEVIVIGNSPVRGAAAEPAKDLSVILAEAGLTMTVTDPEKLRRAQSAGEENTSAAAESPRPRRRREPVQPVNEVLVQVDTRRE
ncbi:MAG: hypothetical protein LBK01_03935, partial [Burkholderiaceae bacterium]|nr:hypothetical protein [Burkholderiaceae bacterium]